MTIDYNTVFRKYPIPLTNTIHNLTTIAICISMFILAIVLMNASITVTILPDGKTDFYFPGWALLWLNLPIFAPILFQLKTYASDDD